MRKNNNRRNPLDPERSRVQQAWDRPTAGREDLALLVPPGGVGVELGVDTGQLTRRFLDLDHFRLFYAVDKWNDRAHSLYEYQAVTEKLQQYSRCRIYRMTAQDFAEIMPDDYFDFIYIDCYAHTGQDGGTVLEAMWPKLKPGGLFSGDDYEHKLWPKTTEAVDGFAADHGYNIFIHSPVRSADASRMDQSDSWYFHKR